MDESAQKVVAAEAIGRAQRRRVATARRLQLERAVRHVRVVVVAVDPEHMLKVAAAEDEDSINAVGAERAYQRSA